ncbi:MAG: ATPase [Planctomycetota bacterium]
MRFLVVLFLAFTGFVTLPDAHAKVDVAAGDGFRVTIKQDSLLPPEEAYQKFVSEFSQWYDARHSYSMDARNLSLDLDDRCMLEKLPDGGFVRHMEIVFHQPGKLIRLAGGLGPLQGMGIQGAMTVSFLPAQEGSQVTLTYVVTGASFLTLDKIAGPVDQVLTEQMTRFQKHCDAVKPGGDSKG